MRRCVILLGGNVGDTRGRFAEARELIESKIGEIVDCSTEHSTEAWGFESQTRFWNQAVAVESDLTAEDLLSATQSIEQEIGRDRERESLEKLSTQQRYASRVIDIDIITYGEEVVDLPQLQIPHPLMSERAFVLEPMAEICADWRHPILGKSTAEMLQELLVISY
ncbi:MAG: 2-amino-4-hydroxy-6-hydroxymethyldihydropteridine diphosphokinase [Rikenellaceae bacterium]